MCGGGLFIDWFVSFLIFPYFLFFSYILMIYYYCRMRQQHGDPASAGAYRARDEVRAAAIQAAAGAGAQSAGARRC